MVESNRVEASRIEAIDPALADQIGYSGTQTAKVVGISYRQLDYWARTDLIRPSLTDAAGSGSRRRYSYSDLLELKTIKKLIDAGIKLEQVRKVFEYLREHVSTDIASAHIVIDGGSVVLCDGDQTALRFVTDELVVGQATGHVDPGVPTVPLEADGQDVWSLFKLGEGESAVFAIDRIDDDVPPRFCAVAEAEREFNATVAYWRRWLSRSRYKGRWREMVHRSALTLHVAQQADRLLAH
jgi:DNA-binding transcriptional MerR regulator